MDDRELLTLAAKAAGIDLAWDARGAYQRIPGVSGNEIAWSPLTDDGAALRLAVTLQIDIEWAGNAVFADGACSEFQGEDPCAATRRAIVRVAAEIGRGAP